ncbi:MAG TPA: type II toxin-antitoxin system prevent-host-death family antitoxin [Phycicoccus sp.]|nr:type II toxin-antitoxin system prevent-host-death family antitoxin [Phycicoccus sp.]
MSTISARQFNRDVSAAKRAAKSAPVVITDRGEPRFVLLSIEEFRRLQDRRTLADILRMDEDIEFEPACLPDHVRPAQL